LSICISILFIFIWQYSNPNNHLFGLTAYVVGQRRKEIGIRKVLGASVADIVTLISGHFLKLTIISISIALPVAWWMMYGWLENFAYHTAIRWWMFTLVGIATLLVALFTVGIQSARAAFANPVKSIRLE